MIQEQQQEQTTPSLAPPIPASPSGSPQNVELGSPLPSTPSRSPSSHRKTPPPLDEAALPSYRVVDSNESPAPPPPVVVQPNYRRQLQPLAHSQPPAQTQFISLRPPPSFWSRRSQEGITLTFPIVDASLLGGSSEVARCQRCHFVGFTETHLIPTTST
ncbi:hypothetical protein JCM5350_006841 [Sporobolomyces pararoseus]